MTTTRYIALKPDNLMDGLGPMTSVREFTNKRDAVSWVKKQTGIMGGKPGDGWAVDEETVDDEGRLSIRTVWPFTSG